MESKTLGPKAVIAIIITIALLAIGTVVYFNYRGELKQNNANNETTAQSNSGNKSPASNNEGEIVQSDNGLLVMNEEAAEMYGTNTTDSAINPVHSNDVPWENTQAGIENEQSTDTNGTTAGNKGTKGNPQQLTIPKLTVTNGVISKATKLKLIEINNFITLYMDNEGFNKVQLYLNGKKDTNGQSVDIKLVLKELAINMEAKRGYDDYFKTSKDRNFSTVTSAWKELSSEIDNLYMTIIKSKSLTKGKVQLDLENFDNKQEKFTSIVKEIALK